MKRPMHYWLMKSEPEVYSIEDLKRDKRTLWTGVRNFQARNYMLGGVRAADVAKTPPTLTMEAGDLFLFYHSNATPPACAGVGTIENVGVPDPEQFDKKSENFEPKATKEKPMWYCADVAFKEAFSKPISLDELRGEKALAKMVLLQRGSRLSVQPVTRDEFHHVLKLAAKK